MDNYSAMVVKLENVRKHPNADRLMLADAAFEQVIIGLEHADGEIGVFVPAGTVLSPDFLISNLLYRKHPESGQAMGGYIESNGRVRFQKLRGEMSRGLWLPMSCLHYLRLKELPPLGASFSELEGHEIVRKYVEVAKQPSNKVGKTRSKRYLNFPEIGDTGRLNHNVHRLKTGDVLYLTEKIHSTSGRTGYPALMARKSWMDTILQWFNARREPPYEVVSGTRRTILSENPYHLADDYRSKAHEFFKPFLAKNMVIYYEICANPAIMPTHDASSFPTIAAKYGKTINYTYGVPPGSVEFFVYKIVVFLNGDIPITYTFEQLMDWCALRGVQHVPLLDTVVYDGNQAGLMDRVKQCDEMASTLDATHPMEGIVIHSKYGAWKYKGSDFCLCEDIKPYSIEDEV